jgi:hypothetical protein
MIKPKFSIVIATPRRNARALRQSIMPSSTWLAGSYQYRQPQIRRPRCHQQAQRRRRRRRCRSRCRWITTVCVFWTKSSIILGRSLSIARGIASATFGIKARPTVVVAAVATAAPPNTLRKNLRRSINSMFHSSRCCVSLRVAAREFRNSFLRSRRQDNATYVREPSRLVRKCYAPHPLLSSARHE